MLAELADKSFLVRRRGSFATVANEFLLLDCAFQTRWTSNAQN
jgi:hypothetical protein